MKAKQFLIQHVEKIVLGIVLLGIGYAAFSALSQETFDKEPEELATLSDRAREHVRSTKYVPPTETAPKVAEIADKSIQPVPGDLYQPRTILSPATDTMGGKRGEPTVLTILEPQVESGFGALAYAPRARAGGPLAGRGAGPGMAGPGMRPGAMAAGPGPGMPATGPGMTGRGTRRGRGAGAAAGPGMAGPGMVGPGMAGPGATAGGRGRRGAAAGRGGRRGANPMNPGAVPGPGMGVVPGMAGPGMAEPKGVQAPADSRVRGAVWSVITAVVPQKAQSLEFNRAFRTAAYTDPMRDTPQYTGYLVERAEVKTDAADEPLKWAPVSVTESYKEVEKWALVAPEVVDPYVTHEALTMPLPPLLERDWGDAVAHKEFPVIKLEDAAMFDPALEEEEDESGEDGDENADEDDNAADDAEEDAESEDTPDDLERMREGLRGPGAGPGMMGGPGGVGPGMTGRGGTGAGPRRGGAMAGPGMAGPGMAGPGMGMAGMGQGGTDTNLLLRFFDFTVEEGKRYRYRVALVVANPNYELRPRHLERPELAEKRLLVGPFCEPTPVVTVSRFTYVRLGPAKAARGPVEAETEVIVTQWEKKTGLSASTSQEIVRGQLANFSRKDLKEKPLIANPLTGEIEEKEIDFRTNVMLVDLKGGEKLPGAGKLLEPAEGLFLNADGRLTYHSELTDREEFTARKEDLARLKETFAPPAAEGGEENPADFLQMMGPGPGNPAGRPGR